MKLHSRTLLFFFGWLLALGILSAGYVDTVDAEPSLETARALLDSGTLATHPEKAYNIVYARAADFPQSRAWYTKVGLGMPLLYLPALVLGRALYRLTDWNLDSCERFFISQVNNVLTALLLTLFFVYGGRSLGAFVCTLALGVGTLLLPYAKTCHRETALALFLFLTFISAKGERNFLTGLSAAMVFLTKNAMGVCTLPILIWAWRRSEKSRRGPLALPLVVAGLAQAIFQFIAFGSIWKTGYASGVLEMAPSHWPTPVFSGIWLQLFSWEHGLLFYSPLLVLVLVSAVFFRGSEVRSFRFAILSSIAIAILLHARWPDPSGGDALGPRYLVPIIPLCFLLLPTPEKLFDGPRSWLVAGLLIGLASVQQFVNTAVKAQQYGSLQARSDQRFSVPQWQANFMLFSHKWNGQPEIYDTAPFVGKSDSVPAPIDLIDAPTLAGFNFWWNHIRKPAFASLLQPNQNPQP